ncbi:hypothetical protein [Aneurinibacillus aneurinilyticus]
MIIHKVEERRCTRRRVPSSFSHKEEMRTLCGARAGPAKHLGITVRETNRRPFGARCGDDPLWIILDNQHPWYLNFETELEYIVEDKTRIEDEKYD